MKDILKLFLFRNKFLPIGLWPLLVHKVFPGARMEVQACNREKIKISDYITVPAPPAQANCIWEKGVK